MSLLKSTITSTNNEDTPSSSLSLQDMIKVWSDMIKEIGPSKPLLTAMQTPKPAWHSYMDILPYKYVPLELTEKKIETRFQWHTGMRVIKGGRNTGKSMYGTTNKFWIDDFEEKNKHYIKGMKSHERESVLMEGVSKWLEDDKTLSVVDRVEFACMISKLCEDRNFLPRLAYGERKMTVKLLDGETTRFGPSPFTIEFKWMAPKVSLDIIINDTQWIFRFNKVKKSRTLTVEKADFNLTQVYTDGFPDFMKDIVIFMNRHPEGRPENSYKKIRK